MPTRTLPEPPVRAPLDTFAFSSSARDAAAALAESTSDTLVRALLDDLESEGVLLAARRVLGAFLEHPADNTPVEVERLVERVDRTRVELHATVDRLLAARPAAVAAVLAQRAPLALTDGCWLDTVSQPATEPDAVVCALFGQHFRLKGEGRPGRSVADERRRAMAGVGVHLPSIDAHRFLSAASAQPDTVRQLAFYLALSRFPANFLPEVVGVHYARGVLGIDDRLYGSQARVTESDLEELLDTFVAAAADDAPTLRRLAGAVDLVLRFEREHVELLARTAARVADSTVLDDVAAVVRKHLRFAGAQHRAVRVGGESLAKIFDEPEVDVHRFLADLAASRYLRPGKDGADCRFLRSIKFGGPMFGIFDDAEAAVLRAWAEGAGQPESHPSGPAITEPEPEPRTWIAPVPADVVFTDAEPLGDRQLFHRLVNAENFPCVRPAAKARAEQVLDAAENLFVHGARGRYTDASFFPYDPQALVRRVESVYFDKLVAPYRPLTEIPDRETVVAERKNSLLTNLVDGSWIHTVGGVARYRRDSDAMLFAIYADEMGRGDPIKNHVTIIHHAAADMGVRLPHIGDAAFQDQDELPDASYGQPIHQLCLALFPDTFHDEIMGYNLGMEMWGLGELCMHEIQRLRRHGFDVSYEEAHLSIDNMSAGHARQAAELINSYLDDVRAESGTVAVEAHWRRIWRGYASFAHFVERDLVAGLVTDGA